MTKRADATMDQSEEIRQLKDRVDCVPDWIWEVDLDGRITHSNIVVRDLLGHSPRRINGRSIFDMMVEEDAGKCRELFNRALATAKPIKNVTTHFLTKDSSIRTVEVSCTPMRQGDGKLAGFRGISRDITGQLDRQQLAEQVVQHSQVGIFIVQDSVLVYVNPRICELMGYSSEEVLGTPIWKYVHPDDAVWLAGYQTRRLAGEDLPAQYVARGLTKQGEIRHLDFRAAVIQHNNAPAILLDAIDITDAVRARDALATSEREFRDLVEKTSDWVWQVDENAVYTYASPRSREMLGYEPEEIVGKTPFDLMPPDEAIRVGEIFAPIAARRESFAMLENTMVHHDGHLIVVETSGEPIFDEQGEFRGYRGMDRDITQRKEAEEQLRKATSEMETVLHAFPDLYFWLDADGKIIDYHAVDPTELYAPPEEFMGKRIQEVVPEEAGRRFAEAISKVSEIGSMASIEYPLDMPQGQSYYEARLMPLPDNQVLAIVRNITERRLAEEQLADERDFTAAVLKTAASLVIVLDRQGRVVMFNRACETTTGYTLDELKGKPFWDRLLLPEEAQKVKAVFRELKAAALPVSHENHWVARDGSRPLIAWSNSVLLDDSGEVEYIIGTGIDVTDRRRSQERLNRLTQTLLGFDPDPIENINRLTALAGELTNASCALYNRLVDGMLHSWGQWHTPPDYNPVDKAEGHICYDVIERGVPDALVVRHLPETPYAQTDPNVCKFGLQTYVGQPVTFGVDYVGSLCVVFQRDYIPSDEDLKILGIVSSAIAVEERRKAAVDALGESEERYRLLFERSPDVVLVLRGTEFIEANPALTTVFGYQPEEMIGKPPWFMSPEFQPDGRGSEEKAREHIAAALQQGPQVYDWVHKTRDGFLRDCIVSLSAYDVRGDIRVQALVRDVTERKRAEENRRRLERDVELQKRSFYRETILSVTSGKLNICDYSDIEPFVTQATTSVEVEDASEVGPARRKAEGLLHEQGLVGERLDSFIAGVGEAIANAIKHGVHGKVFMGEDEKSVWVVVSDEGAGIESLILPRAVLLRGFSTKPSLGLGYSIMLEVCDRILLNTGDGGTTVVLIKDKVEHDLGFCPEFLPDTWGSIPS